MSYETAYQSLQKYLLKHEVPLKVCFGTFENVEDDTINIASVAGRLLSWNHAKAPLQWIRREVIGSFEGHLGYQDVCPPFTIWTSKRILFTKISEGQVTLEHVWNSPTESNTRYI